MRLIDADALSAEMYRKSFEVNDGRNVWNSGLWIRYKIFEEAIKDAPTIDAVPVIRCKDCKHYEKGIECAGGYYNGCAEWIDEGSPTPILNDNGFCSYAERKEKE